MLIVGGAMAGYWETGSRRIERAPAIMIAIAITHAKIGRSMKNRAMAPLPRSTRGLLGGDGPGLGARTHLLEALHDHPVTGRHALRHQPRVADLALGDERALLDLAGLGHDERGRHPAGV